MALRVLLFRQYRFDVGRRLAVARLQRSAFASVYIARRVQIPTRNDRMHRTEKSECVDGTCRCGAQKSYPFFRGRTIIFIIVSIDGVYARRVFLLFYFPLGLETYTVDVDTVVGARLGFGRGRNRFRLGRLHDCQRSPEVHERRVALFGETGVCVCV